MLPAQPILHFFDQLRALEAEICVFSEPVQR
jgi:hypothetical protein